MNSKKEFSFKTIDTSIRFLENLWQLFPNLSSQMVEEKLIVPTLQSSIEFCNLIEKNILKIDSFAKGGFGIVGNMVLAEDLKNQILKASVISIKKYGGFELFYMPIIVKVSIENKSPSWNVEENTISISDPFSEMVFGAIVGHIYDLGLNPFVTKYFGNYLCKSQKTGIIIEKSHFELRNLFSREIYGGIGILQKNPDVLLNLCFQYSYCMYMLKYYFGLTHFDTQHRNIMCTYIHNRDLNIQSPVFKDYIYQGENLSKKSFILFETHKKHNGLPVFIAIKNNGLLLKVIDFGVCFVDLSRSQVDSYKKDVKITSLPKDYKNINAFVAAEKAFLYPEYSNTVDLQYTFNNIYEFMDKGLDYYVGKTETDNTKDFEKSKKLLKFFTENFFGNKQYDVETFLNTNPSIKVQKNQKGLNNWVSYEHDTGHRDSKFNNPLYILDGLINVCSKLNHAVSTNLIVNKKEIPAQVFYLENECATAEFTSKNSMFLFNSPTNRELTSNNFRKFIDVYQVFNSKCATEKVSLECKNISNNYKMFLHSNISEKKLYNPTDNSIIKSLKQNVKINLKDVVKNIQQENNLFKHFHFSINPAALKLPRDIKGSLVYNKYQSWFDFKNIPDKNSGKYIENVSLHIIQLKQINKISIEKKMSLWEGSNKHFQKSDGISFNLGYFIVQGNLLDKNYSLSPEDLYEPIGFFYNKNFTKNGTILTFPPSYDSDLAVIYGTDKKIYFDSYINFMSKHKTLTTQMTYDSFDNKKLLISTNIIAMSPFIDQDQEIAPVGSRPIKLNNEEIKDSDYTFAFTTGPVLIKNAKVFFTLDKMFETNIIKTVEGALNNYKYISSENEANQYFGMRHSHRFMVHNVLARDVNENLLFIICEGRGYDSPGLDRVQLSYLINNFSIVDAVSLDGGFSSNSVFKIGNKQKFILNDPEKRKLGMSIYFV